MGSAEVPLLLGKRVRRRFWGGAGMAGQQQGGRLLKAHMPHICPHRMFKEG